MTPIERIGEKYVTKQGEVILDERGKNEWEDRGFFDKEKIIQAFGLNMNTASANKRRKMKTG